MNQPMGFPPNGLWLPREVRRQVRRDRRPPSLVLRISTHVDTWMTWTWARLTQRAQSLAHRYRYLLAFLVIAFSVGDLLLTQTILSMVEHKTGVQPGEANALMAPIVMTWWAWPIRVGIPLLICIRDLRRKNYQLMLVGATLYAAVVMWNAHMLQIVRAA